VKALLLAAGEGTRLRPLTLQSPKPMIPIGGRPILEHLIAHLRRHGVTDLAINLHHQPRTIVEHFGNGSEFGVSITYSHEEQLLGSAGAVKQLEWFLTEPFFVWYADVLTDLDLVALLARHRQSKAMATLSLYEVDDPWRCGIVQIDAACRITRFVEKPPRGSDYGNLANAGVYVVEPELLGWIPSGCPSDFGSDVFPALIAHGRRLLGVRTDAYVLDVGSAERYQRAEADLVSGRFRTSLALAQPH
jgi:NDP-sugar pyrophosphorylase family protein